MAQVFVVDRTAFFGGDWPQGFTPIAPSAARTFLAAAHDAGRFVEREVAERTPAWKQWIPYCVLRLRTATVDEAGLQPTDATAAVTGIFRVQRTTAQGETRLHGAWSIGIGGHVDAEDRDPTQPADGPGFFAGALARELAEELEWHGDAPAPRFVGLLNDDQTPVGAVHAGLVHVWDLIGGPAGPRSLPRVRETTKMRGGFGSLVDFRELWQDPARFESWSQILIQAGVAGAMA